jgi:L-fuculose-phosphate aldolase
MDNKNLKRELACFCNLAYLRKLVSAAGGNISARIPGTDTFIISPSGVSLRDMEWERLIVVNAEACTIEGPEGYVPSMETPMHLAIYHARPQVQAVVHLHPVHCTALSSLDTVLPLSTVSAEVKMGKIGLVPLYQPGSQELADAVERFLRKDPEVHTLFLKRHGVISCGGSISEAFDHVDLAEEMAAVYFLTQQLKAWSD